jgi:hypothetical protein
MTMPYDEAWLRDVLARGDVRLVRGAAHLEPPPLLSEAAFQAAVRRVAKGYGWAVMHVHDSRRSPAGFPDLVLVRNNLCIYAELKTADGVVTLQQWHWLKALGAVEKTEAFLWRPSDMPEIVERLRG